MSTTPVTPVVPRTSPSGLNGSGAGVPWPGAAPAATAGRLPRTRRSRRPGLTVAGALLVGLCGVASAALVTAGHDRVAVLALARDVHAGQQLTAADLRVAHLSGDGISALAATSAAGLVGQTVTASLPAGTVLNPQMLTATPLPAAGSQLVAVAVKAGGVPAEATAGRDVTLVRVQPNATSNGAAAAEPVLLVTKARVVSVQTDPASGLVVLSVQVPAAAAAAIAQASAAGAVAVTLLPVAP